MSKQKFLSIPLSALALLAVGCAGRSGPAPTASGSSAARHATASIQARSGSAVHGTARFIREGEKVKVRVSIEGATPGIHACHIHETGDCSAADGSSAGGHWNPTREDHGRWGETPFHLGDLGNIEVGQDGKGELQLASDEWTLGDGGPRDVMGKSVVVHASPDDFKSQPAGAAGARVGCGVIQAG